MAIIGTEQPIVNIDAFLWSVCGIDLAYVLLASIQRVKLGWYPAQRHHVDLFSKLFISMHVTAGIIVVWGGCASWIAIQQYDVPEIPLGVVVTMTVAALVHSGTNMTLLRKIPGVRVINVPIYLAISLYNVCRALWLLDDPTSQRELFLLWCSVSTFIWVRFYLLIFLTLGNMRNDGIYDALYTAALPYAGILGIILPAAAFGADPRWYLTFGAVAVLGPPMILVHTACNKMSEWSSVSAYRPCLWLLQCISQAIDPDKYHGQCTLGLKRAATASIEIPSKDLAIQLTTS
jgi:hypothetical protein